MEMIARTSRKDKEVEEAMVSEKRRARFFGRFFLSEAFGRVVSFGIPS